MRRLLFILGIAGVAISTVVVFALIIDQLGSVYTRFAARPAELKTVALSEAASFGLPARLKIPKLKVDAAVEPVGLTPEGAMDIPKGPEDVAWFALGPRPGQPGSAVISGHYGWKNGIPAVFDNLHKLQPGDKIYVEDERGATTTFVVRELRRYGEKADAFDVFGSNDGKAHLNLVTCEGVWNKASKSYSKRLVVFTDKEETGLAYRIKMIMVAAVALVWR